MPENQLHCLLFPHLSFNVPCVRRQSKMRKNQSSFLEVSRRHDSLLTIPIRKNKNLPLFKKKAADCLFWRWVNIGEKKYIIQIKQKKHPRLGDISNINFSFFNTNRNIPYSGILAFYTPVCLHRARISQQSQSGFLAVHLILPWFTS